MAAVTNRLANHDGVCRWSAVWWL